MKKTQSFSVYAFIIALLIHLLVYFAFLLLDKIVPVKQETPPAQEQRFKVSLKEIPQPKIMKAPPMPYGEQLTKLIQSPPVPKQPVIKKETLIPIPSAPLKPHEDKNEPVVEQQKPFERHTANEIEKIERIPKKEFNLFDKLSTPDGSAQNLRQIKLNKNIEKLYGSKFGELSKEEQKYILNNTEILCRTTQPILDRYASSRIPSYFQSHDYNIAEFFLYPDGSISDFHFIKQADSDILNSISKDVLEFASKNYPRPPQKTLIRFQVGYQIR